MLYVKIDFLSLSFYRVLSRYFARLFTMHKRSVSLAPFESII